MTEKSKSQRNDLDAHSALLDTIVEGVLVRRGAEFLYMNDAVRAMIGIEGGLEKLNEHSPEDWVHPDDRETITANFTQRVDGLSAPKEYEFRIIRADGSVCWVNCKANQISWHGESAVVACLTDITEQKRSEHAIGRGEQLFTNIFRMTPEVMMLINMKDARIIDINPAFLNVFGLRRDDIIGSTSAELGIWADTSFLYRFVEELKMTASMTDVPTTVRTRGNVIRHFRLFAQKIEHDREQVLLLIGRDVTDELRHSEDLQRSKDNAELANRAKSDFLANMSHELRTPLNAILGFAEILRDEMIGPIGSKRYSEYAGDIHQSGTHLLEIINDILDLSKVEAGELEAHLRWTEPGPCLETCLTLVQQQAFDNNISLKHDLDQTVLLEADERLIKQLVLNLLNNAVKFTEPGGTVTLELQRTASAGLRISVRDTGIGMTPDEIKIARRPFGQVESEVGGHQEGSGLGLPLVAAFAEKLSAVMTIDSEPKVGTTVSISFPPHKVRDLTDEQDGAKRRQ